ncbi:DUF2399 domain-containing protein [Kineococcus aurantiacus]|uniref:DUF2399 domain-containing protein n=1 Tax=Kineococcus aurantiacus TaxID=37633 RepID=UPI0031D8EE3F
MAWVKPGKDGTPPRDRKGRFKVSRALLTADGTVPACSPGKAPHGVADVDWRWVASAASRQWQTVAGKMGSTAWSTCVTLAVIGVLEIDVTVDVLRVGAPIKVWLTQPWVTALSLQTDGQSATREKLRQRADNLSLQIDSIDSGLAAALKTSRAYKKALPILVAAAQDLLDGATHDGPRAFSQTHFGNTKTHDDAPEVLTDAGVSPESLAALGLNRSPYLGLGGAITVAAAEGEATDLRHYAGPVRYRIVPAADFAAELTPHDQSLTLAIVENLQAAEAVCDAHGASLAVAWCAGQPADNPLDIMIGLASGANRVLICPDADWGGVRIAARIIERLPAGTRYEVLDPGTAPHQTRKPFSRPAREGLEQIATSHSHPEIRKIARAVVERGYPVEQEASARSVLAAALSER